MCILLCSSHDFNEEYLLCKPITEVQEHIIGNVRWEHINNIGVTTIQISHGLTTICHIKILVIEDGLHTFLTVINVDIKGLRTKRLRENHGLNHIVALPDFLQTIV